MKTVDPVLFVIAAGGGVIFWFMMISEVFVQPFAAVTVTVYVPGIVNVLLAIVVELPPLQEYVPPPVAVTFMAVVVQVNIVVPLLFVIPETGGVVF